MSPKDMERARRLVGVLKAAQKELDELFNPTPKAARKLTPKQQYEHFVMTGKGGKPRL